MTDDKNFKRLIRERMAKTGESYATARAYLEKRTETPPSDDDEHDLEAIVCSFCNQAQSSIIAGPSGAYICSKCIGMMSTMTASEADRVLPTNFLNTFAVPDDVKVQEVPAMRVAAIGRPVPGWGHVNINPIVVPAFYELNNLLKDQDIERIGQPFLFYYYERDGYGLTAFAAREIGESSSELPQYVSMLNLPALPLTASIVRKGPLGVVFEKASSELGFWVRANNYEPLGFERDVIGARIDLPVPMREATVIWPIGRAGDPAPSTCLAELEDDGFSEDEAEFTEWCATTIAELRSLGAPSSIWGRLARRWGAVQAARSVMAANQNHAEFDWLVLREHPELTIESGVLDGRWRTLFGEAAKDEARRRLTKRAGG